MFSAFGAGAVVGAAVFGLAGRRLPRRLLFIGGFSLIAVVLWAMALTPPLWVLLAVLLLAGVALGPVNPLAATIFQERTPQAIRGRVFGLIDATAFVAIAPGRLLAGYLIEWLVISLTFVILGVGYLLVVLWMLVNPGLRALSEENVVTIEEAPPSPKPTSTITRD